MQWVLKPKRDGSIIAVQKITPKLVRLGPEHQEFYLDNETALIKTQKPEKGDHHHTVIPEWHADR